MLWIVGNGNWEVTPLTFDQNFLLLWLLFWSKFYVMCMYGTSIEKGSLSPSPPPPSFVEKPLITVAVGSQLTFGPMVTHPLACEKVHILIPFLSLSPPFPCRWKALYKDRDVKVFGSKIEKRKNGLYYFYTHRGFLRKALQLRRFALVFAFMLHFHLHGSVPVLSCAYFFPSDLCGF